MVSGALVINQRRDLILYYNNEETEMHYNIKCGLIKKDLYRRITSDSATSREQERAVAEKGYFMGTPVSLELFILWSFYVVAQTIIIVISVRG